MSFTVNTNNEYWIVSYYLKNPEQWGQTQKDLFCLPTSIKICEALEKMYVSDIKVFNIDTLLNFLIEAKVEIERDQIEAIYNTYNDFANIEEAFKVLQRDKIRQVVNSELLEDVFDNVHTGLRTDEDVSRIQGTLDTIQEKISTIMRKDRILLDANDLVDNHIKLMTERRRRRRRTTGDSSLDRLLTNPFAPGEMTTLFGQKSSGKSTYAQNIAISLVKNIVPVLYLNLEMGQESWMDKALCMQTGFPLATVMYSRFEEEQKLMSTALSGIRTLDKLFMIDDPVISISDLDRYISETQRRLNTEYMVSFIDLTTMLQDFSNAANTRELDRCVNRLNEVVKNTGTHIVNIVQENENRFRGNKINKVKSLKYFKPKITDIKDAASIAERSRVVLYIWNEFLMKQSFFPDEDDEDKSDMERAEEQERIERGELKPNILEIKVIKQNMGIVGGYARYNFNAECFRLKPCEKQ